MPPKEPRRFPGVNDSKRADLTIKSIMRDNDLHIVISGTAKRCVIWNKAGERLFQCEARTDGWEGPGYDVHNGDTPPGLYECGVPIFTQKSEPDRTWFAYGPVFVDLVELQDQERSRGRAGVGLHGGGSGLPDPLAPKQGWYKTHGCVRFQNHDIMHIVKNFIIPCQSKAGTAYVNVMY